MRKRVHVLVVPDLHLEECNYEAIGLIRTLDKYACDTLIVAGDLHEKHCRLSQKALEVITYLRGKAKKVVFIKGNHDPSPRSWFWRKMLRVKPVKKFVWEAGGKKFCVMHGDRFDRFCFVFNMRWVDKLFSGFVWLINRVDPGKNHLAWFMNWVHERFAYSFAKRARRYAARHEIDVIICAHTHKTIIRRFLNKRKHIGVKYINCGNRVGNECPLVTVDKYGNSKLRRVGPVMALR